jgi:murein L,D-transpeptidase YcbB/YkuD
MTNPSDPDYVPVEEEVDETSEAEGVENIEQKRLAARRCAAEDPATRAKYDTFVHVDNRAGRWRSPEISGGEAPSDFPGKLSRARGSKGAPVCQVQERLRQLGHAIDRFSSCPFGPQTESAVKAFQRSKGLPQTGVVNRATWDALFA